MGVNYDAIYFDALFWRRLLPLLRASRLFGMEAVGLKFCLMCDRLAVRLTFEPNFGRIRKKMILSLSSGGIKRIV